jgi:hypothetical protein
MVVVVLTVCARESGRGGDVRRVVKSADCWEVCVFPKIENTSTDLYREQRR